ncbi:MAG: ribonuclease Z [Bacteroidetes bacterium]|nr:ribonuclease Z [Bacteroidota bacterium]
MSTQTFELLILGSSAATPTSSRNPTAQLLNIAERFFLIDCGEGTQMQLRKYKARFQSLNHIFISHLHGDHFLGLPGFLASMHLLGRKNELTIYGPKELEEIITMIHRFSETQLNYPLRFVHTQNSTKQLLWEDDKVEVYSIPLKHRIATTGFLFQEKPLPRNIDKYKLQKLDVSFAEIHKLKQGFDATDNQGNVIKNELLTLDPAKPRSYAFCSDTKFFEALAADISNVNLLYHESTFLEDKKDRAKQTFHSTAKQAAQMALLANAGQLLLGHFSARYGNLDEFLEEAKPIFGNTELAIEGKLFSL